MRFIKQRNHKISRCILVSVTIFAAASCTQTSGESGKAGSTAKSELTRDITARVNPTPAPAPTTRPSPDKPTAITALSWKWDPTSGGDCRAVKPATIENSELAIKALSAEQPTDGGASLRTSRVEGGMSLNGYTPECLYIAGMSWSQAWRDLAKRRLVELAALSLDQLPPVCTSGGETLLSYLVKCALDADKEITVTCSDGQRRFRGQLDLVPEWHDKKLVDVPHGRERITACLMAHANHQGATVPIWLHAPFMSRLSALPRDVVQEGAFAGNLFPDATHPLALLGYRSPSFARVPSTSPGRVCTLSSDTCGFDVTNTSCSQSTGTTYYSGCTNQGAQTQNVITTYLRQDTLVPVPIDRAVSIEAPSP